MNLRRLLRALGLAAAVVVLAAALAAGVAWRWWTAGDLTGETVTVRVPSGAGSGAVADTLLVHGLLEHRRPFLLALRWSGRDARLQAGRFQLPVGASPRDLAVQLTEAPAHLRIGDHDEGAFLTVAARRRLKGDLQAFLDQAAFDRPLQVEPLAYRASGGENGVGIEHSSRLPTGSPARLDRRAAPITRPNPRAGRVRPRPCAPPPPRAGRAAARAAPSRAKATAEGA